MSHSHEILLYYKYVAIKDPEALMCSQQALCKKLNLTGRIIVSKEGINGTVEGIKENTDTYIEEMRNDPLFSDIHFKHSTSNGSAFPRLSVKVRDEIVSLHLGKEDFSPLETTATHLPAEELHKWLRENKKIHIVDMRNDYEFKVGHFKDSIFPNLKNFRDLPSELKSIEHLKDETVVTVCTGGVRCEKASGYLLKKGFKNVYQLDGGIVTYMEKYPEQDFLGKLYVFDGRITMGFENPEVAHTVVGKCDQCSAPSENFVNCKNPSCNAHFICCELCGGKEEQVFCSTDCKEVITSLRAS